MTRITLALALVATGLTVAASQASATPIDPNYKPRVHRTWHPTTTPRVARTWHPKPCQVWPRPTGCPAR